MTYPWQDAMPCEACGHRRDEHDDEHITRECFECDCRAFDVPDWPEYCAFADAWEQRELQRDALRLLELGYLDLGGEG